MNHHSNRDFHTGRCQSTDPGEKSCTSVKSIIAPYVKALYLYGSCARHEQSYESDVDLFLELQSDFDIKKYRDYVILLKGEISPADKDMAEVNLKVVVGDSWKRNKMLYYQNILREGVDIWKRE